MKEEAVASHIQLDAAQQGVQIWRNNSGALPDKNGRPIWYGLGSFKLKDPFASSDYVGITPTLITPDMVGQVLGVFTAIETKESGWKFNPKDVKEQRQLNFINLVQRLGGYAGFANKVEDFRKIVRKQFTSS